MNLLDLFVKVGVNDETSKGLSSVGNNVVGKLGSIASAGAKLIGGAVVATGVGTAALGKMALDGYATYEQLEGGINKLFGTGGKSLEEYAQSVGMSVEEAAGKYDTLNQAHDLVMTNAQKAYATAGMSANQYMEQVSGFAAALTNSLGGDTVKAAEQADVAMRAISDNVNTFGSDMESVQMAFQGFAKQNYTMLDNLKLGYGGTKEEMERLIADANEYGRATGQASDLTIDSFSDIVTAIDLVQQKQGIAGTTAREAATTIEGSVNMAKAAWSNWVTELGKDNADMEARTQELVDSLVTAANNIVPRIAKIAGTLIESLPTAIAQLGATLIPAVVKIGGSLLKAIGGIIRKLFGTVIPQVAAQFNEMFKSIDIGAVTKELRDKFDNGINAVAERISTLIPTVIKIGSTLAKAAGGIIRELFNTILPQVVAQFSQIFKNVDVGAIVTGLQSSLWGGIRAVVDGLKTATPAVVTTIANIAKAVADGLGSLIPAAVKIIGGLTKAIAEWLRTSAPALAMTALAMTVRTFVSGITRHLTAAIPELVRIGGSFIKAVGDGAMIAIPAIIKIALGLIKDVADNLREAIPAIIDIASIIMNLTQSAIQLLIDSTPALIEGVIGIVVSLAQTLLDSIPTLLERVGEFIANLITLIGEKAPEWTQQIGEILKNTLDELIQTLPEKIPAILEAATGFILTIGRAIVENAPIILQALLALLIDLAGYVVTHIPDLLAAAVQLFGALLSALIELVPQLLGMLVELIVGVIGVVAGAVDDMLVAAGQWFTGLIEGAGKKFEEFLNWASGIPDSILKAIGDVARLLWGKGSELIDGLREGAENAAEAVFNFMRDLPSNILNALGDLGSLLWDAGNSLFEGLFDGMESGWNGMTGWIGGIADQIANLKGPLPYDRKVLIENGQALMQGLRGGLKGAFESDVIPYVSGMAGKMADAFGETDFSASYDVASARATTAPQASTAQATSINVIIKDTVIEKEADVDKVLERVESTIRRRTGGTVSWSTSPSMV